jgi:hypothetical protein
VKSFERVDFFVGKKATMEAFVFTKGSARKTCNE